ncbi:MAG: hypothetical protein ACRELY_16800 [Polyangiaceae bacterium]
MRSVVLKRFLAGFALMCAAGIAIATNSSCVLIDGPPDLPVPPVRRPTIIRSQVTPSALTPIGALPPDGLFTVPIEISDPTQSVTWVAFIDYGQPSVFLILSDTLPGSSTAADIQTVTFNVPAQRMQGGECHTILFLVALSTAFNNSNAQDTDPSLSDTVVWYFAPGGNEGACTTYDGGGNDGAFPNVDGNLDDADDGSSD